MKKIFLAIGVEDFENYLKKIKPIIEKHLGETVEFTGETVYRGGIVQGVTYYKPDIVIIREGLPGNEEFSEIILNLKLNYPNIRIIFLAGNREVGDALLATLVQYGIYDLIIGSKLDCTEIIKKIIIPNTLSDVAHFLPKIKVDERTNKKIFEAPEIPNLTTDQPQVIKSINDFDENIEDDLNKNIQVKNSIEEIQEEAREETEEEKLRNMRNIHVPKTKNIKLDIEKDIQNKKVNTDEKRINYTNEKQEGSFFGNLFKGNKKNVERVSQQVLTFIGGSRGTGNSQISFNIALDLAERGYKTIYMDLNDKFSSISYIYQLGYSDAGIENLLNSFKTSNYTNMNLGISNPSKILAVTDKDDFLYKTYSKLPKNIDFLFFSEDYMNRDLNNTNPEIVEGKYLKDLIIYLFTNNSYDFIIIDTPSDIYNELTENALIYSSKIFFTITQDVGVIGNHIKDLKVMMKKGINFKEKFYYLLNKYENAGISNRDIETLISNDLRFKGLDMITIPNINKEILTNNFEGVPLIWNVKSKEFKTAFSKIIQTIIN
ncbi:MAG: hypothetical protein GX889_12035 [Clostridiales bacterium]|nr:hypothetical protein [Clostridiales bacterium]